jgi:hypothetical protein
MKLSHITATGLLLLGLSANLTAETVDMPASSAEAKEFSVQVPGRGMSMETVLQRFGEPTERVPAVGTPPISRWIYSNFTVYFESEYVIHSVVNNSAN